MQSRLDTTRRIQCWFKGELWSVKSLRVFVKRVQLFNPKSQQILTNRVVLAKKSLKRGVIFQYGEHRWVPYTYTGYQAAPRVVRDWSLLTGREWLQNERGRPVKFYPSEKGGGAENVLAIPKGVQQVLGLFL